MNGLLLCLLDGPGFRLATPVFQLVSTCLLLLVAIHYAQYGDFLQQLLTQHGALARWVPPFWFLALYDHVLYGAAAPPFAGELAPYALRGTALVLLALLVVYPLGWVRMHRLTVEGSSRKGRGPSKEFAQGVRWITRQASERAVLHFIGQTIRRNSHYQVYLALYAGTGMALALACAFSWEHGQEQARLTLSVFGLHAALPLLLFWVVAGLRMAFAFPINLPARWVFRVTGAETEGCAAAGRTWATTAALLTTACFISGYALERPNLRPLIVLGVVGSCLSLLLADAFFFERRVPFITPRMPGRTNFALMLTLYVGALTPLLFGIVKLELYLETHLWTVSLLGSATLAAHLGVGMLHREPMEVEEEMEGYDGAFQVLGLS